jgi:hypothetical protein
MARSRTRTQRSAAPPPLDPPRCVEIADRGIKNSRDFRDFMSALMSDLAKGKIAANTGNAMCNAGGKMLKMVDLEYKYGTSPERKRGTLTIAFETPAEQAPAVEPPRAPALVG